MGKELTKEEYEEIGIETRHNELLEKIALSFNDKAVIEAIIDQGDKSVAAFEKAISIFQTQEKPEVNIETNQDLLISSVREMHDEVIESNNKLREAIETRLLPDTFTLIKNYGVTESVKVHYKPANQITI